MTEGAGTAGSGGRRLAAAVDFGGTKLMVGIVREDGVVVALRSVPTPRRSPDAVADESARILTALTEERGIDLTQLVGVGSTVPGMADASAGLLRLAPALGWRDLPFASMLEERLGLKARIANDVNACAVAEQRYGAAQGVRNFLWMTVSTGIGGALVIDGRLYEGGGGLAGEIGHINVERHGAPCGCGRHGCLEAMAAGLAIARRGREAGLDVVSAREVASLARAGESRAVAVIEETAVYLGRALAVAVNLLDPDLIVLGGGVSGSLDLMRDTILHTVLEEAVVSKGREPRIIGTPLGQQAALIGAATLVL
jgi:glucokinase